MESLEYPRISRENNFDVVRLFAALQVCTGHTFSHFNIPGNGFTDLLAKFPGVTIFFALSGFLITSSWCHTKSIKHYIKNRFLRIFPALFICFIVLQLTLILLGYYNAASVKDPQIWMYWVGQLSLGQFFTPDSLRGFGVGTPNGSLWTIPIEIEFYIIIPLTFILLSRINIKWKIIILAILSLIVNIWISFSVSEDGQTVAADLINSHKTLLYKLIGVSVAPYLYCFLTGSLIYIYWDKIKSFFINKALYWLSIYLLFVYSTGYSPSHSVTSFWILISNLLLACSSISAAFSFGNLYKFLYGIDLSYGIYIIHMIVVNLFIEFGYGYNLTHAFTAMLITFALAFLLYKYIEKPSLKLKNKQSFKDS